VVQKSELLKMLKYAARLQDKTYADVRDKGLDFLNEIRNCEMMIDEDKGELQSLLRQLVSETKGHRDRLDLLIQNVEQRSDHEF